LKAIVHRIQPNEERFQQLSEAFAPLTVEIFRINGALLSAGNRLSRDLRLSSARWQVLGALQNGPLTVPHIARNVGSTRQSVRRLIELLARQGRVKTLDNPHHRKSDLVQLTDDGQKVLNKLRQRQRNWHPRIMAGVNPAALRQAATLLRRIREQIEQDNE
jgi:DNA-binding MarR family transcriptional regulator